MSGRILSFSRLGSRGERVADLLLSSIGIATPVRREDDYGVDFHCELGEEHPEGYVTYHSPFILQVKTTTKKKILYGEKKGKKWSHSSIGWLFENKSPFFIGVVDPQAIKLSIYDTSGLWQLYNKTGKWVSQIQFLMKSHPINEMRENVISQPLKKWKEGDGDGFRHTIDLGNPLVVFTNQDLDGKAKLLAKKAVLTDIVRIEQKNIRNRDLRLRLFTEIKETKGDLDWQGYQFGVDFSPHKDLVVEDVLVELQDELVSMMIKLKAEGRIDVCNGLKELVKIGPKPNQRLAEVLYKNDPDLFDYLAP